MAEDKTDRIIDLLEEILKWIRFQGWKNGRALKRSC